MLTKSELVWMDGELVPWSEAKVHVLSHTLHYGFGIFEGIRAYRLRPGRGGVFRLREHTRRSRKQIAEKVKRELPAGTC